MFKFKKLLSCGKVMFLHLSVILFTGGGILSKGVFVQGSLSGGLYPSGSLSRGVCVRRGPLSRVVGLSLSRGLCQGNSPNGYVQLVRILLECILVIDIVSMPYQCRILKENIGTRPRALCPVFFMFMQFSEKDSPLMLTPPSGKSWIRHCI